jgi:hypothetical protein
MVWTSTATVIKQKLSWLTKLRLRLSFPLEKENVHLDYKLPSGEKTELSWGRC